MTEKLNYLLFILLSALWGGSYIAIKIVIDFVPPLLGVALRLILAFLFLAILFRITKENTTVSFQKKWKIWLAGLFALGIPFSFLFWAEHFISPGLAGILCATVPIWAYILSLFFLHRSTVFCLRKCIGLIIGIIGVCIIFWPMLTFHGQRMEIMGSIAAIIMSISYAIGALLNQQVLTQEKISFQTNIYHQLSSSSVFILLLAFIFEKWPSITTVIHAPSFIIACIYLGFISTTVAWLLYYYLIREWGAVRASAATFVAPIMAVFWDWLFFRNYPALSELAGVAIILIGVVLIQFSQNSPRMINKECRVD